MKIKNVNFKYSTFCYLFSLQVQTKYVWYCCNFRCTSQMTRIRSVSQRGFSFCLSVCLSLSRLSVYLPPSSLWPLIDAQKYLIIVRTKLIKWLVLCVVASVCSDLIRLRGSDSVFLICAAHGIFKQHMAGRGCNPWGCIKLGKTSRKLKKKQHFIASVIWPGRNSKGEMQSGMFFSIFWYLMINRVHLLDCLPFL